ncbi:sialidase family protein [Streptomyces sp. NPDC051940]|uniref:WD40/YVTN/BNR-like repeat-containing protein n=1 Tax=Streptomyces sp. NPDC051940 TaxID=3155675 RepID=UPI00343D39D8
MRHGSLRYPVAAAALLLLAGCGPEAADAGRAPADVPYPVGALPPRLPAAGPPGEAGGWDVLSADFHDTTHGFALLYRCPQDGDPVARCEQRLSVLDDGGWAERTVPLPPAGGDDGVSAVVTSLGPRTALVTDYTVDRDAPGLFTTDGGRTWTKVDRDASGTTVRIPDGVSPAFWCDSPDENMDCERPRLAAHDPATGRLRVLAVQPPLDLAHDWRVEPLADGTWWVWGRDPASGDLVVASSRDDGRSWRTSRLAGDPGDVMRVDVFGTTGRTLYASLARESTATAETTKNPLSAVYASTDGGRTWDRRWTHRQGRAPWSALGTPLVGADGSLLLVTEDDRVFRSRDGARTFAPGGSPDDAPGAGRWVWRTRAGYLLTDGATIRLSADGTRWSEHHPAEPFGRRG